MALPVRPSAIPRGLSPTPPDSPITSRTSRTPRGSRTLQNASALNAPLSSIAPVASQPATTCSTTSTLNVSRTSTAEATEGIDISTSPTCDGSTIAVARPTSIPSTKQAQSTTPTMCSPLIDSSPLSSPISPLPAPPGAWYTQTAKNSGSTPAAMRKSSITPPSPGSTTSFGSNISRKRSRADFDDDATSDAEKASKHCKKGAAPKKTAAKKTCSKKPAAAKKHAAKKPAKLALPASTRPSRDRKAPSRYLEETPKKPVAPRKAPVNSKTWQPKHVTESYQSRLCKVDVYHMLLKDESWACLTLDQKRELFSMLPKTNTNERLLGEIQSGKADVTVRALELKINSSEFRTDVATYLNELRDGYMSRKWQEEAHKAMIERAKGTYDDWKDEESETWWGQK